MDRQIQSMEVVFQALGDATRLRILGLLLTGEVCVCDIHDSLGISQPKASRHLAYLRRAGLVDTRREGLWIHYRLADSRDPLVRTLLQAATHALGHVDGVKRDTHALRKRTGCCVPVTQSEPAFACCAPRSRKN
jgi:ArsR family transcriptional regulator, arsenate/arsenite/antimonite-responsive transcriptional repressor